MKISSKIKEYAIEHGEPFTCSELYESLVQYDKSLSKRVVEAYLNSMLANKDIIRISRGVYEIEKDIKGEFIYPLNKFLRDISRHINTVFPFIDFCLWQTSAITRFMHHIPARHLTFVDVERSAMESVFDYLRASGIKNFVLLNPSQEYCDRYINNDEIIIVRPLVGEAPIKKIDCCYVPSLEKILVDCVGDRELSYLQGSEIFSIYDSAFAECDVNVKSLLRYASRRNRKEKVQQIINQLPL